MDFSSGLVSLVREVFPTVLVPSLLSVCGFCMAFLFAASSSFDSIFQLSGCLPVFRNQAFLKPSCVWVGNLFLVLICVSVCLCMCCPYVHLLVFVLPVCWSLQAYAFYVCLPCLQ